LSGTAQTPPRLDPPALDQACLDAVTGDRLGVAVSGGGDSLALLQLLIEAARYRLEVITVDHGLRPESAQEAQSVAKFCEAAQIPHHIARWENRRDGGNLSDQARLARKALIGAWARTRELSFVALGHTADDQAETFLMRLSRGSGVQGLSAMDTVVEEEGLFWLRPLLHVRRPALRHHLTDRGIAWIDDPTNEDERYTRVKMRRVVETLSDAGISVPAINKTTTRLRSAKQVLYTATKDLAEAIAHVTPAGEIRMERARFLSANSALQLRLLSEAIRLMCGSYYTARAHAVEAAIASIASGKGGVTLSGSVVRVPKPDMISIRREPARVDEPIAYGKLWDERWMVEGPAPLGSMVGALGEAGLAARPNWRDSGLAREVLLTTPAVWNEGGLISAPMLDESLNNSAQWRIRNPFFTPAT